MPAIPPGNVSGMRELPSLASLRAFEAAARHLNFTHAAAELDVGQPAISRQIRQLEAELGVELFVRRPSVRLTDAGRGLFETTTGAFGAIASAVGDLRRPDHETELTIDVSIGFASCWLLRRMADFSARHPEFAVRLVTRDLTDVVNRDADVSVYYGLAGHVPDAQPVFPDDIVPVVAADYPSALRPGSAADLAEAPLLGMSERVYGDAWSRLFRQVGRAAPEIAPDRRFTSFIVYREALLRGQGVGLAWRGLMDEDLTTGRLEPVTNMRLTTQDYGYWVCTPGVGRGATAFSHWLLTEARQWATPS